MKFFLSAQEWWLENNPKFTNFGMTSHLHTEVEWDHKRTISGKVNFPIKSVVHNVPEGAVFRKLMVQAFYSSDLPLNIRPENEQLSGDDHAYALERFSRSNTSVTTTWNDVLTVDCNELPYSGWCQFRIRAFVKLPNGDDMRTSTRLHAWVDNGKPRGHLYTSPDELGGRGWYGGTREVNYTAASLENPPDGPVSGVWKAKVFLERGHQGIPVTYHRVAIDPQIHAGNEGTIIKEGIGEFFGIVEIDTTKLLDGVHKLGLLATALFKEDGSENSAHTVISFEVKNGNTPPVEPPSDINERLQDMQNQIDGLKTELSNLKNGLVALGE